MTDQLTPPAPPAPPVAPGGATGPVPPPAGSGGSAKVVAILTATLGGAIALGLVGSAVITTVVSASTGTETSAVTAAGVRELDIDVSAGSLRLEFADVSQASLDVTGGWGSGGWTLEREGDELIVSSPDWTFGGSWLFGGDVRAVLTLPRALETTVLDAQFTISAGELDASGRFGELGIDMGAGSARVSGEARDVTAGISAGRADLDLSGVDSADLRVSAGRFEARLTGDQPSLVDLEVSAGSLDLTLPEGSYDVTSSAEAGQIDNRLETSASSPNRVAVQLSAGSVSLRSAD